MKHDAILVLDFGGQYCNLIARRIREHNVYSEIVPCDITTKEIEEMNKTINVKGMILSGGPWSVYEEGAPKFNSKILDMGIPPLSNIIILLKYLLFHLHWQRVVDDLNPLIYRLILPLFLFPVVDSGAP